jgi:hypothetical protein
MPSSPRRSDALSTRRSSVQRQLDPSSAALVQLRIQLGALVARLMDIEGEWKTDPAEAPGWWLSTWGRRLAVEKLAPPLAASVLSWLAETQELLDRGYTLHLDTALIRQAESLHERGEVLQEAVDRSLAAPPHLA